MRQTVKTLADLKSIRFGIFDEIFCEQTEREYFFKTDGGLTPDDLEIVLPVQGGNLRLVAKTGYGGHVENEEDPVGLWDADANVPELENGVSGAKKFYRVAVAGTVDFGDGDVDFEQGDYAVQDEDLNWDKLDKDGGVVSFAGRGGAVVPQASDYSAFFQLGLKCALLRDIKANGTDGGNAAGSGRQRRTLNSKIDPHSLVALTDDVFVPVIGAYVILAQAPAQDVGKTECIFTMKILKLTLKDVKVRTSTPQAVGGLSRKAISGVFLLRMERTGFLFSITCKTIYPQSA